MINGMEAIASEKNKACDASCLLCGFENVQTKLTKSVNNFSFLAEQNAKQNVPVAIQKITICYSTLPFSAHIFCLVKIFC